MFATIANNTKMINNTLQMECVTLRLFGLTTKVLINDIFAFIIGIIISIIVAEMLADHMIANIEAAKREAMQKKKNAEYIKHRNETQGLKKVPSQTIIQCDKCFNEYNETEIKTQKIIGHIFQQYCIYCINK